MEQEDYQQDITPEYGKHRPDCTIPTLGEFAETVTFSIGEEERKAPPGPDLKDRFVRSRLILDKSKIDKNNIIIKEDNMKNLPEDLIVYSTPDLGVAVFLFTSGHELVRTTVIGQSRLVFHFERKENTDKLVATFLDGSGKAPAKKLFENYRALRTIAFSQTNNLK